MKVTIKKVDIVVPNFQCQGTDPHCPTQDRFDSDGNSNEFFTSATDLTGYPESATITELTLCGNKDIYKVPNCGKLLTIKVNFAIEGDFVYVYVFPYEGAQNEYSLSWTCEALPVGPG
eukprot:m.127318 g.127318  ORF g.127318 m.127318 type:complete len:118 (-) comp13005_c0_seq3:3570-3923(-)